MSRNEMILTYKVTKGVANGLQVFKKWLPIGISAIVIILVLMVVFKVITLKAIIKILIINVIFLFILAIIACLFPVCVEWVARHNAERNVLPRNLR